jgi:predicted SAM-dependent methyltransferase
LKEGRELLIEVGAGDQQGANGWTTIDVTRSCDIYWDLRRGIPFPDATVSKIYSSHFLEHLSFAEGQLFLGECVRVLKPGGVFSICVPNARIYLDGYAQPDCFDKDRFLLYGPAYNRTTKIDYVNYIAYMDGHHKYMFDEENLLCVLQKSGLNDVRLRDFDDTLDRKERQHESIYAWATRL